MKKLTNAVLGLAIDAIHPVPAKWWKQNRLVPQVGTAYYLRGDGALTDSNSLPNWVDSFDEARELAVELDLPYMLEDYSASSIRVKLKDTEKWHCGNTPSEALAKAIYWDVTRRKK